MYGQKLDMRKLFAKADKKGRGKINEEEFRELVLLIDSNISKDVIKNIFKKIDKDGSGFVEYEEFSNYLKWGNYKKNQFCSFFFWFVKLMKIHKT